MRTTRYAVAEASTGNVLDVFLTFDEACKAAPQLAKCTRIVAVTAVWR